MSSVRKLLQFQTLLKKYNSVYRDCESIHSKKVPDNDIEHSYRVALLCWMIIDEYKLPLDRGKVLQYALLHDLPEVYAGDVSLYSTISQATKSRNEARAILKLRKQFPKQKRIWDTLDEYEEMKNEESKFVYLIEKLEPILLVATAAKDHFKKKKIPFELFFERKQRKIKDLDAIGQFLNKDLMKYLKANRKKFKF